MKVSLVATAAVLVALSAPGLAQSAGPAPSNCFIEVQRLMADGPNGIVDLRSAISQLNDRLRLQVDEVNRLKRLAETLSLQQQQAMQAAGAVAVEEGGTATPQSPDVARITQDLRSTNDALAVKQTQLQIDYETQMQALVGPVQQRVGQRALAYGSQHGCANMKMARSSDMAGLQASGARNMTLDFVSWYGKP